MKFFENISHKEHKGREDHKEGLEVFVRYLIVKSTRNFRTKPPLPSLCSYNLCDLCEKFLE